MPIAALLNQPIGKTPSAIILGNGAGWPVLVVLVVFAANSRAAYHRFGLCDSDLLNADMGERSGEQPLASALGQREYAAYTRPAVID